MYHNQVKSLPHSFLFGAATAAHQVEGGNTNSWTVWEETNAERLARESGPETKYGQEPTPVWDDVKTAVKSKENYISGNGVDFYHRYKEDLAEAQKLGLGAFRFSVEWSRVERVKGKYDQAAISHYLEVVLACRELGLEPFVTLWHFTLPVWAEQLGGWTSDEVVQRFAEYAERMGEALRRHVTFIATLNEPEVYAMLGYMLGVWPPALMSPTRFARVRRGLVRAHRAAYATLKRVDAGFEVGFCTSQSWLEPSHTLLRPFKEAAQRKTTEYFTERLHRTSDWIGMQYYMKVTFKTDTSAQRSDLGWALHPEGHAVVLKRLGRYGKPLYVTESGLADAADTYRAWYIEESLTSIAKAVADGVDCRGYFYWSLLDNFEWHEGYWPKFGLLEVDRTTMERRLRPSAKHYATLIRAYRSGKLV